MQLAQLETIDSQKKLTGEGGGATDGNFLIPSC